MNGLGGLNKSDQGVVIGMVQLQLPTVATKAELFRKMPFHMANNGDPLIPDGQPPAEVATEIYRKFLSVASGEKTHSERQGLGDLEFVPWQIGATL